MSRWKGLAYGLARQAYTGKLKEFFEWREQTLRDIMPVLKKPAQGKLLSPTEIRRAAEAVKRHLKMSGGVIHQIEEVTDEGRLIGAVLLMAARRTINGKTEGGSALNAQAVVFILGRERTGIIARNLDLDIFQHAMQQFIARGAQVEPKADPVRDQSFFDGLIGAVLLANLLAEIAGEEAKVLQQRGYETPIVLPFGDDILMGRVVGVEPVEGDHNLIGSERLIWDKVGYRTHKEKSLHHVDELDVLMVTEIKTHVLGTCLHPQQIRLRDRLEDYRKRHALALQIVFEGQYLFERSLFRADEAAVKAALEEMIEIRKSADWLKMVRSADGYAGREAKRRQQGNG